MFVNEGGVKGGRGREGRTSRPEDESTAEEEGEAATLSSPIIGCRSARGGRCGAEGGGGPRSSEGGGKDRAAGEEP